MREVERQLRDISRALENAARGFGRLTELVAELRPEFNSGGSGAQGGARENNHKGQEQRRLQPAADLPGSPQASTQALEQALMTSVDEKAKDYLTDAVELFEDADRGIPELRDYSMRSRSAYLAMWAGRGRALQAKLEPWWEELPEGVEKSFRVFFGKLTTVTKRLRCEWVDALHRAWSTDWEIYVKFYQRRISEDLPEGQEQEERWQVTPEEEQTLARDRLDGLLQRNRPRPSDARQLILEASEVLDTSDSVMADVLAEYASLLRGHDEFTALLSAVNLLEGEIAVDEQMPMEEEALEGAAAE